MNTLHRLLLVVALPLGSLVACTPATPKCSPSTCTTGCCSATGVCETGSSSAACGRSGAACMSCGLGTICTAGSCQPNNSGVGGGSAVGGGTTAGGSAAGGSAAGGSAAGGSAAGGSAAGGSAAGGSAAGGSAAGGSAAGGSAGCSAANCPGCCLPNGTCTQPPDNRNNTTCGTFGVACVDCTLSGSTCSFNGSAYACTGGSAGGSAAGGSAAGGSAAGGSAAGGSAAGGSAAGGSAAGGSAAGGSAAGGSAAGGSAAGGSATSTLTGTYSSLNFLANGTTAMGGLNLTTLTIEAYVPNGASYTVLPGTGQVNGTFSIPNVPAGTVLVRVGNDFLETSARSVSFTNHALGRPNAAAATVNPTTTNVAVSALQPWVAGQDQIVWVSPNLGNFFYNFPLTAQPAAGATSANMSGNFNGVKLVNQAQGDDTWLLQLRVAADAGVSSGRAVAATQLAPFTQLNGQTTSLTATMQSPPTVPSLTQSFNWNLNAFSALQPQLPAGTNPKGLFALSPVPSTTPNVAQTVDLWWSTTPASMLPPTSFTLVTPFPSGWSIVGRIFFTVDMQRLVAGTTGPLNVVSGFGHYDAMSVLTSAPITPRLGPPTNLQLNGTPFTVDRMGVGTTVSFAWTAPTLGTVTTYYLRLIRLTTASGSPTAVAEGFSFSTDQTSLTVPSGLLIAGQPYLVEVSAVNAGFNARAEFDTVVVPQSLALIVSPIFRP